MQQFPATLHRFHQYSQYLVYLRDYTSMLRFLGLPQFGEVGRVSKILFGYGSLSYVMGRIPVFIFGQPKSL